MTVNDISNYGFKPDSQQLPGIQQFHDSECRHPESFWMVTQKVIGCRLCGAVLAD